jgi:putative transposase
VLCDAGVHVVQTPFQAPNANAYAERFVRSITFECLDRMVPLGERHFRRALKEFVDHYHGERNHQGLENRLIDGNARRRREGAIRRRPRLGGLLNDYERALQTGPLGGDLGRYRGMNPSGLRRCQRPSE